MIAVSLVNGSEMVSGVPIPLPEHAGSGPAFDRVMARVDGDPGQDAALPDFPGQQTAFVLPFNGLPFQSPVSGLSTGGGSATTVEPPSSGTLLSTIPAAENQPAAPATADEPVPASTRANPADRPSGLPGRALQPGVDAAEALARRGLVPAPTLLPLPDATGGAATDETTGPGGGAAPQPRSHPAAILVPAIMEAARTGDPGAVRSPVVEGDAQGQSPQRDAAPATTSPADDPIAVPARVSAAEIAAPVPRTGHVPASAPTVAELPGMVPPPPVTALPRRAQSFATDAAVSSPASPDADRTQGPATGGGRTGSTAQTEPPVRPTAEMSAHPSDPTLRKGATVGPGAARMAAPFPIPDGRMPSQDGATAFEATRAAGPSIQQGASGPQEVPVGVRVAFPDPDFGIRPPLRPLASLAGELLSVSVSGAGSAVLLPDLVPAPLPDDTPTLSIAVGPVSHLQPDQWAKLPIRAVAAGRAALVDPALPRLPDKPAEGVMPSNALRDTGVVRQAMMSLALSARIIPPGDAGSIRPAMVSAQAGPTAQLPGGWPVSSPAVGLVVDQAAAAPPQDADGTSPAPPRPPFESQTVAAPPVPVRQPETARLPEGMPPFWALLDLGSESEMTGSGAASPADQVLVASDTLPDPRLMTSSTEPVPFTAERLALGTAALAVPSGQPPESDAFPRSDPPPQPGGGPPPPRVAPDLAAIVAALPDGPTEVALSPDELGRVSLTLQQDGDTMRILVLAERGDTLDLLRRHGDVLMQEFRAAGFSGTTLSFGGWGSAGDRPQPDGRTQSAAESTDTAQPPFSPPPSSGPDRRGLDLRL